MMVCIDLPLKSIPQKLLTLNKNGIQNINNETKLTVITIAIFFHILSSIILHEDRACYTHAMQSPRWNKLLILQSVIFILLTLSFILPSGNYNCIADVCTLSIGNWHMHDALWHISLSKLGFGSWPLQNPYMAGESLTGYNFLLDYLLNLLGRLGISPFFSFFKLIPVLCTALYVFSVSAYLKVVTTSQRQANFLAFFLYFGSSATYLATLYSESTFYYASLRGFPVVSVINPPTMFLNIQYAISLSIFIWIMLIQKHRASWVKYFLLFALFFLMFGFKFYGGVVALVYLFSCEIFTFLHQKQLKSLITLLPSLLGSYLGLILFYGLSKNPSIPFTWSPFALTHLMIDDALLFGNHNLTLARYYLYENQSGFSPRLWVIEGLSIILFLVINFGTRLLGIYYMVRTAIQKRLQVEQISFTIVIIITTLIPILFVQNGGWYNTMQFLYYGTWLAGILTAQYLYTIVTSKKIVIRVFVAIILLLTIPNSIEQLRFITAQQNVVTSDELSMLEILKIQDDGVVHVSEPTHKFGLVPALAQKPVYYLDTDQLMVTHAAYQPRLAIIKKYGGGSIATVPAQYYIVYKSDYGAEVAIQALTSPTQYERLYDSATMALYKRL